MPCCRLRSLKKNVPDQLLYEGRTLTIGRNRICRIKSPKCAKQLYKATISSLKDKELTLVDAKTGKKIVHRKSDIIKGPGFEYEVDFVDEPRPIVWTEAAQGELIKGEFKGGSDRSRPKIAAFDLDGTIILTKSGKTFAQDRNDWKLMDSSIPEVIRKLTENHDYRFVIISNQAGLANKSTNKEDLLHKIESVLIKLNQACTVYIAPGESRFRKPNIGTWEYICQESLVEPEDSIFVGDAAGRKRTGKAGKNDHSAADLLFAYNSKLKFFTPEVLIQRLSFGSKVDFVKDELGSLMKDIKIFNPESVFLNLKPSSVLKTQALLQDAETKAEFKFHELPRSLHCILFCGLPASGKSTFFRNYLEQFDYVYINRDTLKTMPKCYQAMKDALASGKKCVIDNTNVERKQRKEFVDIANKFGADVIAMQFELPVEHVFHNIKFRKLMDEKHEDLSKVVVYTARKKFEPPKADEGFKRVVNVNFVPKFDNDELRNLYLRFLLDK